MKNLVKNVIPFELAQSEESLNTWRKFRRLPVVPTTREHNISGWILSEFVYIYIEESVFSYLYKSMPPMERIMYMHRGIERGWMLIADNVVSMNTPLYLDRGRSLVHSRAYSIAATRQKKMYNKNKS